MDGYNIVNKNQNLSNNLFRILAEECENESTFYVAFCGPDESRKIKQNFFSYLHVKNQKLD